MPAINASHSPFGIHACMYAPSCKRTSLYGRVEAMKGLVAFLASVCTMPNSEGGDKSTPSGCGQSPLFSVPGWLQNDVQVCDASKIAWSWLIGCYHCCRFKLHVHHLQTIVFVFRALLSSSSCSTVVESDCLATSDNELRGFEIRGAIMAR